MHFCFCKHRLFIYVHRRLDLFALKLLSVECVAASSHSQVPAGLPRKRPLAKHLSFDQICEVATIEHKKLFSIIGNQHHYVGFFVFNYLFCTDAFWHFVVFGKSRIVILFIAKMQFIPRHTTVTTVLFEKKIDSDNNYSVLHG